ncbi:hypothetical protein CMO96_04745 [Candidatus Woesebacteria bacterium]|nr:hypothetical protein [Candidatus Woesebacteria bacterium]
MVLIFNLSPCGVFFGKTPASTSDKPRAASAVVVVGKIRGGGLI